MDFVFDLKTLGTKPGSAIISCGMTVVDRSAREIVETHYFKVDLREYDRPENAHFMVSGETINWWLKQSDAARKEAVGGDMSPREFLDAIEDVIVDHGGTDQAVVWGYGATFDVAHLEWAYKSYSWDVPWCFYNVRCLRTLCAELGVDWKRHLPEGGAHIAAEDSEAEAKGLLDCFVKIDG
jgi:hypothetical protein